VCVILPSILIAFFTALLCLKYLGDAAYVTLVTISIFLGIVLYFGDRIKEVNLKDLVIKLTEAKKVLADINTLSKKLAGFFGYVNTQLPGTYKKRKKFNDALDDFVDSTDATLQEKQDIMRKPRLVERLMDTSLSPAEQAQVKEAIKEQNIFEE